MKRIIATALGFAAAGLISATPAAAGFYLEGLQPYAGDYCADADTTLSDPLVEPHIDWENASPSAETLEGHPPYTARGCKTGKYGKAGPGRVHPAVKIHSKTYRVPQK
ncbi:hypothetical protein [Leisingera caerulea]|uniref:hypothetical protein n=1 Tax=Leisingera caerulea TaxID=506591 RepID=UPI0003FEFE5E|nr:hypothetical protein [Leisingera caerulea]